MAVITQPALLQSSSSPARRRSGRRSDIQGLRAILMAQVLLYHAWKIGSPIGVDSFIMVSAYLMTASFLRRTEAGKMPSFVERWGNTFKRLLPPLVVVVLATLAGSILILTADRWREITIQSFASITYWENWRLAAVSADYYADDHALSSPLQHLWSMSMQGQVFLLWPVLMTVCVLAARKLGARPRVVVAVAFGALTLASLLWLIFAAPSGAGVYFDTRSRIWEFALGSMIAALAPWIRLSNRLMRIVLPVSLTVLIVYCLVSIGSYPGPMAAVPMLSVSAVLLFNHMVPKGPVNGILSWSPLVLLGGVSYSVYLVHWPVFVLYLAATDKPQLEAIDGVALIGISVVLGWALTVLVDNPLRKLPWSNSGVLNKYAVIAMSLIVGLAPVAATYQWINVRSEEMDRLQESDEIPYDDPATVVLTKFVPETGPGSEEHPGARVLLADASHQFTGISPIPDALTAKKMPQYDGVCPKAAAEILGRERVKGCTSHNNPEESSVTAVVAGSSHAQQLLMWQIGPLLDSQGWGATSIIKGNCAWTDPEYTDRYIDEACAAHNQNVLDYVEQSGAQYAFLLVTWTFTDPAHEEVIPGVENLIRELTSRGVTVFGIRDNLRSTEDLFECSRVRPPDAAFGGCVLPEEDYLGGPSLVAPFHDIEGFHLIDMTDAYCIDGLCPTIIGNIYVYMDNNHVSTAYSRSVAPFFSQRVLDVLREDATTRD